MCVRNFDATRVPPGTLFKDGTATNSYLKGGRRCLNESGGPGLDLDCARGAEMVGGRVCQWGWGGGGEGNV